MLSFIVDIFMALHTWKMVIGKANADAMYFHGINFKNNEMI